MTCYITLIGVPIWPKEL